MRRLSHSTVPAADARCSTESNHAHLIAHFENLFSAITEAENARADLHRALARFKVTVTKRDLARETLGDFLRTSIVPCA